MRIWKKAISAALAAALIASLTASAAFATKGAAATDSDQTDHLACLAAAVATTTTCAQVADGISTVTLSGDPTDDAAGISLYVSVSGATIISAAGDFVLAGGIVTDADPVNLLAADTMTLRAPAVAGSAVVSVYEITTATGIAALEGTLTITFTATSGLAVSEANSTVKIVSDFTCAVQTATITSAVAALPAAVAAGLCVTLKDGNGSLVAGTPSVAITITPVGLVHGNTPAVAWPAGSNGQIVSENAAAGIANFQIVNTGLAGVATIGIQVTQGAVTTTFAPKTFTFTGALASITATSSVSAIAVSGGSAAAVKFTGKDAAGNAVPVDVDNVAAPFDNLTFTGTTGAVTAMTDAGTAVGAEGLVTVACAGATAGTNTVTIKVGAVVSNVITVYCSEPLDTYTLAFDKDTVAPGGTAILTITAKDDNGLPAPDAAFVVVSTVSSGAITPWSALKNGKATATFLAPFNTGTATVLVSIAAALTTASASDNINVTAPVPLPGTGTNASALGVSKTAAYSTATKVAALNTYQTFKISYGAGAAGQTVGILVATKSAAGVWSSFTRLTGRVADASGTAWFSWRNSAASWISVRGDLAGSLSNAVQARWR